MNSSTNMQDPLARQHGLVVQEVSDEVLVYDTNANKAHCLNSSAAFVWRSCDGKTSVDDIVRRFESDGRGKVTADFVWLAIDQLSDNGLMESRVTARPRDMSRRQVIKKIGLATVVAIPVVASLVAPSSALATASCACVSPGACNVQTGCPSTVNCNGSGVCAP
jgi:hypothetical protein